MATRHYNTNTVFVTSTWNSLPLIPYVMLQTYAFKEKFTWEKGNYTAHNSLNPAHTYKIQSLPTLSLYNIFLLGQLTVVHSYTTYWKLHQ